MTMADWNELHREYGPMVVGISWRLLRQEADVEDNVQETFLAAYQLHAQEPIGHWGGLFRRLATLGALARLRKRRGHASLNDLEPVDRGCLPEQDAMARELQERLREAVAELPQRQGAVFSLRYFEGLDLAEIAQSLQISYQTAGTALCRARARLAQLFAEAAREDL